MDMNLEIWLLLELVSRQNDRALSDSALGEVLPDISTMSAQQLLKLITAAQKRIEQLGYTSDTLASMDEPPKLRITKDLRIFLADGHHSSYGAREIQLKPLCRMLFILFLRHPEGINFKDLSLYENEMMDIYGRITRRGDATTMQRSIRHITDSTNSLMSVHRSQLSRSLARYIDKTILPQYLISTGKGTTRSIPIDRELIEWE